MEKILVTSYINPDIDGVACALAYADLLSRQNNEAKAVLFGQPQAEVQYFAERRGLVVPKLISEVSHDFTSFVIVDASSMARLPTLIRAADVIEVIDHRQAESTLEFPRAKIQNELVGAAATLIVERFQKANQQPGSIEAELLYAAIAHGTLNFTAFNSTARDKQAFAFLEKNFNLSPALVAEMFDFELEKISQDLRPKIIGDAKSLGEGTKIMVYQLPTLGRGIKEREKEILAAVEQADNEYGCDWSVLNIFNMKENESLNFCRNQRGREIFSKAFGVEFQGNWAVVSPRLFRKQIIPKIRAILDSQD